ncbi:MAG: TonB-dependent receptor, partial [Cyclobacteriaceae bacterium]|nr:TonB-dependent receptor [Cyclobacteriaceae bacterium]
DVTKFDGINVRGTFQYKLNEKISLQSGWDINYESGSGGRIKEGTQSIGDYAFFVSSEWKVSSRVQIRPGVRLVHNTIYQAPPFIPSINTKLALSTKHDVRLSYGRGFRAPSLRELYFDFFDANHQIEGNPNLEAELSHSINGSWNWRMMETNNISLTSVVGAYYNAIDNMIGFSLRPGTIITSYINIDKYKTKGVNWNLTGKVKSLEVKGGVGYMGTFNQYSESNNDLDEFVWTPEATGSATYKLRAQNMTFSLYYKFTGETPAYEEVQMNGENEVRLTKISSFNWADFSVQKGMGKHISFTAGVRNLLDVTNVSNTATNSAVHTGGGARSVGNGRSFFFNVSYSLIK